MYYIDSEDCSQFWYFVEFENLTQQSVTKLLHSFDRIIQNFIIENENEGSDSFAKSLNSHFDDFHIHTYLVE